MLPSLDNRILSVINDKSTFGIILERKDEFSRNRVATIDKKFSELTFCTLTANTSAEMGLKNQKLLDGLKKFDERSLRRVLLESRYRFPNTRARFISQNFKKRHLLERILESSERRDLLVETYMGIGMKEASHFLRNVGYFDYPILDKHIQRFLSNYFGREIEVKSKKDYEREEKLFLEISSKYSLEPGIMDLVIWYLMTGRILK
jgi:N-glycosylase/DNA lyase